ncbi:MAG TPA: hypothetical protein VMH39_07355 [Gemmatimonadaceae bacterium]|nr:hypothetical protein [Gemmatimonadaceae bacterium]
MAHAIFEAVGPRRRRRPGGPRRWTAADKAAYLAQFAESHLSGAAFCRLMDLPRATFTLWQREARAAAGRPGSPRARPAGFARVELVPRIADPTARPTGATAGPAMTVVVRGVAGVAAELTGVDPVTAVQLVRLVLPRIR